jgi:hypothetical protein
MTGQQQQSTLECAYATSLLFTLRYFIWLSDRDVGTWFFAIRVTLQLRASLPVRPHSLVPPAVESGTRQFHSPPRSGWLHSTYRIFTSQRLSMAVSVRSQCFQWLLMLLRKYLWVFASFPVFSTTSWDRLEKTDFFTAAGGRSSSQFRLAKHLQLRDRQVVAVDPKRTQFVSIVFKHLCPKIWVRF